VKSFFTNLFEYNHHYNQLMAEIMMQNTDKIPAKVLVLFSHMLNAHHIWNKRVKSQPTLYGVWQEHAIIDLKSIDQVNFEETLQIMDMYALEKVIDYTNSARTAFANKVSDMLFHIINHSTYHRGQIALLFRQHGLDPLSCDYIFYKR
jgi:uncharacterized damage-inducible protein DinB